MSIKDLEEFLSEDNNLESSFDWLKEKNEWLHFVEKFYHSITTWLTPLTHTSNSKIKISFESIIINEENIGDYEVKKMFIAIKGKRVILKPIGTNLIGAKGRIDMIGPYGTVRFLLVDKRLTKPNVKVRISSSSIVNQVLDEKADYEQVEWEWKIVTFPPNVQYIPLNDETFTTSLLSVIKYG